MSPIVRAPHAVGFNVEVGSAQSDAIDNATEIQYNIQYIDNKLIVPPYFSFPRKTLYLGQDVRAILYVPEGQNIVFSDRMSSERRGRDVC